MLWLFLYGEPAFQTGGLLGGWLTWIKAISLLSFVGWIGYWLIKAIKEGYLGRGRWYDFVALAAVLMIPVTVLVRTLEATKQLPVYLVGSIPLAALVTYLALLVLSSVGGSRALADGPPRSAVIRTSWCSSASTWLWSWGWPSAC